MHTKGPWKLEHSITSLGYARVRLVLNGNGTIGFVNIWRDAEEEAQANARLIAAAPELWQACNDALFTIRNPEYMQKPEVIATLEDILTEAIRKAKEK